jgi:hypothetical protein
MFSSITHRVKKTTSIGFLLFATQHDFFSVRWQTDRETGELVLVFFFLNSRNCEASEETVGDIAIFFSHKRESETKRAATLGCSCR